MTRILAHSAPLALMLALAACSTLPPPAAEAVPTQDRFWASLTSHCGKAFAGKLVSTDAADADMRGAAMVMHVRQCAADRIAVPFHIRQADGSWDRSRTWVFTRTATGLRLKHDHRHADGTEDAVTLYGGDTAEAGSGRVQSFPVDAESIAMFTREGLSASVTNIWSVAVDDAGTPDTRFTYQLNRSRARGAPSDRHFEVTFDLTQPVPAPPAPWGAE